MSLLGAGCQKNSPTSKVKEKSTKELSSADARLLRQIKSLESITGVDGQKQERILWVFKTKTLASSSSPAIGADGTIYIGEKNGEFYALNGTTGVKKWEFQTRGVYSSPAVGADGTVYFGARDYKLYALDGVTGDKKWSVGGGSYQDFSPAIGIDGTVYVGMGLKVNALDGTTGTKKWEFKTGGVVNSSPAIGSDGTVYVGSYNGKLFALDGKTGIKKWFLVVGQVYSSLTIGPDGILYLGSWDNVYALKTSSKGPAKSPWPMRGQNARHTGRVMKK